MGTRTRLVAVLCLLVGCGGGTPAPEAPPDPGSTPPEGAQPAAAAPKPGEPGPAAAATAAPAASPATTQAPLLGKLTDTEIQATLSKNVELFDPCYPEAMKKKKATVKVTVTATIGPKGDANDVKVSKSSKDAKIDACVAEAFKKIKFPPSQEGSARVNPLTIELGGQPM
jgi:TonB family protein